MPFKRSEALEAIDRPTFIGSAELETDLRKLRAEVLLNRGRPSIRRLALDLASRLIPIVIGYWAVCTGSPTISVVGCALLAIGTVSIVGSWYHESIHGNRLLGTVVDTLVERLAAAPAGISPMWWRYKHVRLHHRYPGNAEFDPDIQFGALARVTAAQPWRPHQRFQHIYMPFLFALSTISMLKPSEPRLASQYRRRYGLNIPLSAPVILLDKYLPFLIFWSPVALLAGTERAVLSYILFSLVLGVLVAMTTQVQHNTLASIPGENANAAWPLSYQTLISIDVNSRYRIWWWLSGGTSYHSAHHVAPTLTYLELPVVTQLLRQLLQDRGIPVQVHRSPWTAMKSHYALLKLLSTPPRSPMVPSLVDVGRLAGPPDGCERPFDELAAT